MKKVSVPNLKQAGKASKISGRKLKGMGAETVDAKAVKKDDEDDHLVSEKQSDNAQAPVDEPEHGAGAGGASFESLLEGVAAEEGGVSPLLIVGGVAAAAGIVAVAASGGGNDVGDNETPAPVVNRPPVASADVASAAEGGIVVTGTVAANDSDPDMGAVLTYAAAPNQAAISGLTFNSNGTYSFDPANAAYQSLAAGETRVVVFNYRVTDEKGAASNSTLTITVTGTNDTPVAVADVAVATENGAVVMGTVAANDSDVDAGAVLTYAAAPEQGEVAGLTFNANGSYSFNPANAAYQSLAEGETRTVVFNYRVTDEKGATADSVLTITVTGTFDLQTPQAEAFVSTQASVAGVADFINQSIGGLTVAIGEASNLAFVPAVVDPAARSTAATLAASLSAGSSENQVVAAADAIRALVLANRAAIAADFVQILPDLDVAAAATSIAAEVSANLMMPNDLDATEAAAFSILREVQTNGEIVAALLNAANQAYNLGLPAQVYQAPALPQTLTLDSILQVANMSVAAVSALAAPAVAEISSIIANQLTFADLNTVLVAPAEVTQIRATFVSAEAGNGDFNNSSGQLAVAFQCEDMADGLVGTVLRGGDESVTYTARNGQTFDVRDVSGAQRGNQFTHVSFGTLSSETLTAASTSTYINAGLGDDTIIGGVSSDFLVGGAGNDTIFAGANDSIIGGADTDVVVLAGNRASYTFVDGQFGTVISDQTGNSITLVKVNGSQTTERVRFADVELSVAQLLNTAPTIAVDGTDRTASVTESTEAGVVVLNDTGTITFADVDPSDLHSVSFAPTGANYRGEFTLGVVDQVNNTFGWTFNVDNSAIQDLSRGQVLTQTYTVSVMDDKGGIVNTDVVVTINGTNNIVVVNDLGAYDASATGIDFVLDLAQGGVKLATISNFGADDAIRLINEPAGSTIQIDSSSPTSLDFLAGDLVGFSTAWAVTLDNQAPTLVNNVTVAPEGERVSVINSEYGEDWLFTNVMPINPQDPVQQNVAILDLQTYDASNGAFNYIVDFTATGVKLATINGFGADDTITLSNAPAGSGTILDSSSSTSFDFVAGDLNTFSNAWAITLGNQDPQLVSQVMNAPDAIAALDMAYGQDWLIG